jgi:RNA polymerase sigma-70 factor (ECF subfamily)
VRYAERILGGEGSGEDVVQEAFFRLWMHRREVTASGSLRALLYTLTRNAAIDERRRSTRRAAVLVAAAPASAPSPLDAAVTSELAAAAATAVSALPARRREVFTLAHLKGLTHREIAASMGVSPQTVANQMSAALRSLRQTLAVYGGGPSGPGCGTGPARVGPHLGRGSPARGGAMTRFQHAGGDQGAAETPPLAAVGGA